LRYVSLTGGEAITQHEPWVAVALSKIYIIVGAIV
jgi:hypothetical protein